MGCCLHPPTPGCSIGVAVATGLCSWAPNEEVVTSGSEHNVLCGDTTPSFSVADFYEVTLLGLRTRS